MILYFRQVDNFLYSFKSKETLPKIGFEICRVMDMRSLNLQIPFSTSKDDHYNFSRDHEQEVILGYNWDKVKDVLYPHTIISVSYTHLTLPTILLV